MKGNTVASDVTIGLDLGDRRSQVCVLDSRGEVVEEFSLATTKDGLDRGLEAYLGAQVVLEVGTHSPWVSRHLKAQRFKVIVANPREVRLISQSQRKTDQRDAQMLARLGRVDPELLSPVEHRGEDTQKHRALMQSRDGLVRCRTMLINQARGMAKSLGMRLPSCSAERFDACVMEQMGQDVFPGLGTLLQTIGRLTADIQTLDREIQALCLEHYPEVASLRQVPGVGPITALRFVLTLEDPGRFRTSRLVGAYVGLCPRQQSSGSQQPQLGITKCGDPALRRYLVQAAHYIMGPFGPDSDLRRHGLRICERGGKNAKKRAVVAVARKLAVVLHHLWKTQDAYQPLLNANRDARRAA